MSQVRDAQLEVFADPAALARRAAEWMLGLALAKQGVFAVALSGGSTPQRLYQVLAGAPYVDRFPWPRVHWFWGDERVVPHDDPLSNYRMVKEALLARAPIPATNIHAIPTEGGDPDAMASAYEQDLKSFYGASALDPARPMFDVTLLGLGTDGHTASLFPDSPVLRDRWRWAAAVVGVKAEDRITLTYPVLESSRETAFLVEGEGKQDIFARLRAGDADLPAACVRPVGALRFFADRAAAGPV